MTTFLEDPEMPLRYRPNSREYGIILPNISAIQLLTYCLWCGKKLPKRLRGKLYKTIKAELGVEADFALQEDPRISEEFKSDEWWKKRGL